MWNWGLKRKIRKIEREIRALVRRRFPRAEVFSFGAIDIDPKHLAIWVTTETDAQRDELKNDAELRETLIAILGNAGYPAAAIPEVGFAFESEETVKREYDGNWWHAIK